MDPFLQDVTIDGPRRQVWLKEGIPMGGSRPRHRWKDRPSRTQPVACIHGSAILHAEMDVSSRMPAVGSPHRITGCATIYSTLSPVTCVSTVRSSCTASQASLSERTCRFAVPRTYTTKQTYVDVVVAGDPTCEALMRQFMADSPELWNEDIGE